MIRKALIVIGLLIGIVGGLWCFSPASAREPDRCLQNGYLPYFDPRLTTPEPCDEIVSVPIRWGGTHQAMLRVLHPRSMPMTGGDQVAARAGQAATAIGQALDRLGGNIRLDDVTVILTSNMSHRWIGSGPDKGIDKEIFTAETNDIFQHQCPVSWYKNDMATGGRDFVFTLAHEVFHCVQFANWPGAMQHDWVTEASAEYFAYLAVPDYAPEFIADFDQDIASTPLPSMSYEAVVFYLWLGDARGPGAVREFIPTTARVATEAVIPPDMLGEFAKAYLGGTIKMPNGARIPSSPAPGTTRSITGTMRLTSPRFQPYTLNQQTYNFARGKVYDLTYGSRPDDTRVFWRKGTDGNWIDPPTSVAACDTDQSYRVIFSGTRSSTFGDVDVRAQPAASGACVCPVGTWRETEESAQRYFEQSPLAPYGPSMTTYISGFRVLQLNADHTGSLTYMDVVTETRTSDPRIWLRQRKNGGTHFTWKVVNGLLLTVFVPGNNLLTLDNEQHTPSGTLVESRRGPAQSIGHMFSCDASGLHLRQAARPATSYDAMRSTFSTDMDFARIGSAR